MKNRDRPQLFGWRICFAGAGLWTLLGAVPALIDSASAFEVFTDTLRPPATCCRSSEAPGATGMTVYAVRVLGSIADGTAGPFAVTAAAGDLAFAVAFVAFLVARRPWRDAVVVL
ncbi:MAG: hypothetical protein ACOC0Y_01915 [Spirochaetota bacterium]